MPKFGVLKFGKMSWGDAYHAEEVYWKQKIHDNWLRDGDCNTSFFHGCVKKRRAQNKIIFLLDKYGKEQYA